MGSRGRPRLTSSGGIDEHVVHSLFSCLQGLGMQEPFDVKDGIDLSAICRQVLLAGLRACGCIFRTVGWAELAKPNVYRETYDDLHVRNLFRLR